MRFLTFYIIPVCVAVLCGCATPSSPAPQTAWRGYAMGAAYHVKIARVRLDPLRLKKVQAEVARLLLDINRQMSPDDPRSELTSFNGTASTAPFKVSPRFAQVARFALQLHHQTGGAFDPTLEPLIQLWGFGGDPDNIVLPDPAKIRATLRRLGGEHLFVTSLNELIKDIPELRINLSAVVTGYAADQIAQYLTAAGYVNVLVEINGRMAARGLNSDNLPWQVGIYQPHHDHSAAQVLTAAVPLWNLALATAVDYDNYFEDDQGKIYSHILDPKTGWPVDHDLASVTVVAPTCLAADGMASALLVLGPKAGLSWIENQPDAAALFIIKEKDGSFKKAASSRFPRWIDCEPSR